MRERLNLILSIVVIFSLDGFTSKTSVRPSSKLTTSFGKRIREIDDFLEKIDLLDESQRLRLGSYNNDKSTHRRANPSSDATVTHLRDLSHESLHILDSEHRSDDVVHSGDSFLMSNMPSDDVPKIDIVKSSSNGRSQATSYKLSIDPLKLDDFLINIAANGCYSWYGIADAFKLPEQLIFLRYISLIQDGKVPAPKIRPRLNWAQDDQNQLRRNFHMYSTTTRLQALKEPQHPIWSQIAAQWQTNARGILSRYPAISTRID